MAERSIRTIHTRCNARRRTKCCEVIGTDCFRKISTARIKTTSKSSLGISCERQIALSVIESHLARNAPPSRNLQNVVCATAFIQDLTWCSLDIRPWLTMRMLHVAVIRPRRMSIFYRKDLLDSANPRRIAKAAKQVTKNLF